MISFLRSVMFQQPWAFLVAILVPTLLTTAAKLTATFVSSLLPGSVLLAFAGTVLVITFASLGIGVAVMHPFFHQMLYGRKLAISTIVGSASVYVLVSAAMGSHNGYIGAAMLASMALAAVFLWPDAYLSRGEGRLRKIMRFLAAPLIGSAFIFCVCYFQKGNTVLQSLSSAGLSVAMFVFGVGIHGWLADAADSPTDGEDANGGMEFERDR